MDDRQAVITKAATDRLVNFCEVVDQNYYASWHHEVICQKLQEGYEKLQRGESSRIIIEMPPRHGKSLTATMLFPAWALGKSPKWPIIISSYSSDLAEDFGQKTRDFMNEPNYQAIFPTRLRQDTKAKGKWMTEGNGGYTAAGVGGSITGRGFKIGIIDDPFKNSEEARSEVYREKIWNWYTSTFYTRQESVSMIVVIMTRWHLDDLVGRLEAQESKAEAEGLKNYDKWEYVTFPAVATEQEDNRKIGEALWPEKFNREKLDGIRNTVGPYDFASLYQQKPIPAGHQEFLPSWFRYYDKKRDLVGKNLEYFTTVDLAISEKDSADESVILTVAKERNGPDWYRIEETAGHMNPLEVIDAIFHHRTNYRGEVYIETVGYQKALKHFIIEEQRKRKIFFNVNELKRNNHAAKETRIRGLIPLYGARVIWHRKDQDAEYERQLLEFPFGGKDDRIDAMASQLEAVTHTEYDLPKGKKSEEIKPEDMQIY